MSVAMFLAEQELFWQEIEQPEDLIKEVFKVTESDIYKLSNDLFQTNKINLTMISPYKDEKKFINLLKSSTGIKGQFCPHVHLSFLIFRQLQILLCLLVL